MKLKQIPEDFSVKEISERDYKKKGDHCYILLRKKNWTTTRVIEVLANRLRTDPSKFHYAGLKDKNGITEQIISGYKIDTEFLRNIKIKDVELEIVGYGDEHIKVGSHEGNEFTLVIRDRDKPVNTDNLQIPNYFDDQRFGGSIRAVTHLVGEALVDGNPELAVKRFLMSPFPEESRTSQEYRKAVEWQWPNLRDIQVPKNLFEERKIVKSLQEFPGDYAKAIASLSRRILTLCIHAYQSYLFNGRLAEYIEQQEKFVYIDHVLGKLPVPLGIIKEKEFPLTGVEVPALPQLNMRTVMRPGVITLRKIEASKLQKDELNQGKMKQTLTFSLPKGSYATMVAKTLHARSGKEDKNI